MEVDQHVYPVLLVPGDLGVEAAKLGLVIDVAAVSRRVGLEPAPGRGDANDVRAERGEALPPLPTPAFTSTPRRSTGRPAPSTKAVPSV